MSVHLFREDGLPMLGVRVGSWVAWVQFDGRHWGWWSYRFDARRRWCFGPFLLEVAPFHGNDRHMWSDGEPVR